MSRRGVRNLVIILGVLSVLLACAGFALPIDTFVAIVLGWVFYLGRVVPQIRVGWEGVAQALICLMLFAGGLHLFLRWFYRQIPKHDERPWQPRWTGAIVGVIVLMFVSGIAATGIAHQTGWLLRTPGPLVDVHEGAYSAARRAQSTNNLKQIGLALVNYQAAQGAFPPGGTFDARGHALHGWLTAILPHLEQQHLYDQIDQSVPWNHPRNRAAFQTEVRLYLMPRVEPTKSPDGYALTHYVGNALVVGGDTAQSLEDIPDGASETIIAGEAAGDYHPWGEPSNWRDPSLGINRSPDGFGGPFPGGSNVLFADGSVHFLKNTVDPRILHMLATPSGGEAPSQDQY